MLGLVLYLAVATVISATLPAFCFRVAGIPFGVTFRAMKGDKRALSSWVAERRRVQKG